MNKDQFKNLIYEEVKKVLEEAAKRCTQFTLEAFGISDSSWTPKCVMTGADVLSILKEHGWRYQPLMIEGRVTVKKFAKDHPNGKFVITSWRHSMAVIDGKIHDFSGGTGRQVVQAVVEVFKSNPIYEPFSTYTPQK